MITTERVAQRIYVTGNTYAIKDRLKSAGCHWDSDRKQWWIGAAKADAIQSLIAAPVSEKTADQKKDDLSGRRCDGKVEYKGRTYYVIGQSRDGGKLLLTVLDCSIDFWADSAACEWIKHYRQTTRFGGYGRREVEVYQTVGNIRDFISDSKRADAEIKRGEIPDGYCVDLEDGGVKRRSQCDMPAN